MAGKTKAEIIREKLTPVSSPRFFHFVIPKIRIGLAIQAGVLSGGRTIREWDRHDDSLWRGRRSSGEVRNVHAKHVWYGTEWSIGDPLFFSGYASPRDNASLESESVDRTQPYALLELGKKGNSIGHAVTVHRGTELFALQEMESGIGASASILLYNRNYGNSSTDVLPLRRFLQAKFA